MKLRVGLALLFAGVFTAGLSAQDQQQSVVLDRGKATVVLEPYAPNILRVTLSLQKTTRLPVPVMDS